MLCDADALSLPRTSAAREALAAVRDSRAIADLLFLEAWVAQRDSDLAATLRAGQIRRANPALATAIQRELVAR